MQEYIRPVYRNEATQVLHGPMPQCSHSVLHEHVFKFSPCEGFESSTQASSKIGRKISRCVSASSTVCPAASAAKPPASKSSSVVAPSAQLSTLAVPEEETVESKAATAVSERIDMLQAMLDQLKTQDVTKTCVQEQQRALEAEVKALRFQRNSALPARKQLSKAVGRRNASGKHKDKTAEALKLAEAAVVKAIAESEVAHAENDAAVAEDTIADQEVVRLQAIVRSEEGRLCSDPIAQFLKQANSSISGLATSDESKHMFLTMLQVLAATHAPQPAAGMMDVDLGFQLVPKPMSPAVPAALLSACPARGGVVPACPPPLVAPCFNGAYQKGGASGSGGSHALTVTAASPALHMPTAAMDVAISSTFPLEQARLQKQHAEAVAEKTRLDNQRASAEAERVRLVQQKESAEAAQALAVQQQAEAVRARVEAENAAAVYKFQQQVAEANAVFLHQQLQQLMQLQSHQNMMAIQDSAGRIQQQKDLQEAVRIQHVHGFPQQDIDKHMEQHQELTVKAQAMNVATLTAAAVEHPPSYHPCPAVAVGHAAPGLNHPAVAAQAPAVPPAVTPAWAVTTAILEGPANHNAHVAVAGAQPAPHFPEATSPVVATGSEDMMAAASAAADLRLSLRPQNGSSCPPTALFGVELAAESGLESVDVVPELAKQPVGTSRTAPKSRQRSGGSPAPGYGPIAVARPCSQRKIPGGGLDPAIHPPSEKHLKGKLGRFMS